MIVDAIDSRNYCIKTSSVKKKTRKLKFNLVYRRECSSPFQGTAASKVELTTPHGQLYRS